MAEHPLIPPHGGYRNLHAYRLAEVLHDATIVFCERFVDPRSRTTDQMVQAARSGKQNIAEGSVDSATSKKIEIKLTSIARGSLVELQIDYEDYLRQHGLPQWHKDDPRCHKIRAVAFESGESDELDKSDEAGAKHRQRKYRSDITFELYVKFFERTNPEVAANTAICLINQATFLLNRLLARLEKDFLEEGGFTERIYKTRTKNRNCPGSFN